MLKQLTPLAGFLFLVGCANRPSQDAAAAGAKTEQATPKSSWFASKPATATVPAGTRIRVRLAEAVSTERSRPGDPFTATLDEPIVQGEKVLIPKGTTFHGHVTSAGDSGRMKGRAVLALTLDSLELKGARYPIDTAANTRASSSHRKRNLVLIGGGAGLGAALGAIAGGGAGALIGAGAGAAAGTAGAAATGKKRISLPVETPLTFSLEQPLTVPA